MHGGYRGSGATLDWHTTYQPSTIQGDNKPLQPIVPPSFIQPDLPSQKSNKINEAALAAIVGLTTIVGGYAGYKMINQNRPQFSDRIEFQRGIDEVGVRHGNRLFSSDVWGIMRDYVVPRVQGNIPENDRLLGSRSSGIIDDTTPNADDRSPREIEEAERNAELMRPHINLGNGENDVVFHWG